VIENCQKTKFANYTVKVIIEHCS